jgi:hypothetical protein
MIMIVSDKNFFENLMDSYPSLNQRINRKIIVPHLTNDEASLLLAKRILEKRMVEDVEPIYPFTQEGVDLLNSEINGNPRQLIRIADLVIEFAAKRRAIMIDEGIVSEFITLGKNKQLNIRFEEEEPVVKPMVLTNPSYEKSFINSNMNVKSSVRKSKKSSLFAGFRRSKKSKQKSISNNFFNNSKYHMDSNSSNNNGIVVAKLNDNSSINYAEKKTSKNKNKKSLSKKNIKIKTQNSNSMSNIKCPNCEKIFSMELDNTTEMLSCPYCDFMGTF